MSFTDPDPPGRHGDRWRKALLGCVAVITLILVGWMLRATAVVVIPIVFSVFLAILVAPIDRWGTRHAPRYFHWIGHVAAMATIALALVVFTGSIWVAAQQVMDRFPTGQESGAAAFRSFFEEGGTADAGTATTPDAQDGGGDAQDSSAISRVRGFFDEAGVSFLGRLAEWAAGYASTILTTAGTVLAGAVLVFFLTLLMLIEGPRWRKKILAIFRNGSEEEAMNSIRLIATRLRRYLLARTLLGVLTAALYVGWLWIFDVDLLFVWALLTLVLNYIPNLGSLISGLLPVLYAFVTKDFGTAILVGLGILAIEQVIGNFVDPKVQGRQVSLSPLVVLVVLLFWGWIWGVAGAILAVPITIAVLIVSAHVEPMRPLALLLTNETDEAGLDRAVEPENA